MKAVRLREVGVVEHVDLPDPIPLDDEVLVRVTAAGMCGSDRHLVSGEYPGKPPVVLGHEFEGVVVAASRGADVAVGDRVTVNPNIECGTCARCTSGLVAHCERLSAYGVDRDGGFADLTRVLARQAHRLPPTLEPGLGALSEPLSCCLRAMDLAGVQPGQSVAVIGGGVMGQLLVQLARLAGATRVILATRQRERRDLAEALGATATVDPSAADTGAAIAGPSGLVPGGVDVAFEAAGAEGTFDAAIASVRSAGTVMIVGAAPQQLTTSISPFDVFARELRILGSHLNPFTHERAAQLVASGALQLRPLITRTVDLADLPRLLREAPGRGEIKTIAVPSGSA
jgi:2-desacetyl-2-hydroxyethyl bacteriochlorophyllide A dehydrogenase